MESSTSSVYMKKFLLRCSIFIFFILNMVSLPPVMHYFGELYYPGFQSNDLDDLQPNFKKKLNRVIQRLEDYGYPVWVGSTWRDKERQDFYIEKGYSKTPNSLHRGGGESKGTRRSRAADVYLLCPMIYLPLHAHFYHVLHKVSQEEGLYTGANFRDKRKGRLWGLFDLGWDPGHVQVKPRGVK